MGQETVTTRKRCFMPLFRLIIHWRQRSSTLDGHENELLPRILSSPLNGSSKQLHLQRDPRTIHTLGPGRSLHFSYSAADFLYMLRPTWSEDYSSICLTFEWLHISKT